MWRRGHNHNHLSHLQGRKQRRVRALRWRGHGDDVVPRLLA